MNCSNRDSRRLRGFTLIELVIAVTILGVLTTVVFSGLRTGLRIWTRGNAALEEIQASRTSLSLLRDQIQGALPLIVFLESRSELSFAGGQQSLRLVTRTSFRDGPEAAPRWVELAWEGTAGSGRLTAKEYSILSPRNIAATEPIWQGVVLEGKDLNFEYLARRIPGQPVAWTNSWSSPGMQMPQAIRINFEKEGRKNQILLPLEYAENSWNAQWFQ